MTTFSKQIARIRSGDRQALDELIRISRDGKGWLARLEADEREATGINTLKVRYNKVFGYFIEVPKAKSDSVPEHYIRKQTLVNAERLLPTRSRHLKPGCWVLKMSGQNLNIRFLPRLRTKQRFITSGFRIFPDFWDVWTG